VGCGKHGFEEIAAGRADFFGESPRALEQRVLPADWKPISFVIWLFAQLFSTVIPWAHFSANTMGLTLPAPPPIVFKLRMISDGHLHASFMQMIRCRFAVLLTTTSITSLSWLWWCMMIFFSPVQHVRYVKRIESISIHKFSKWLLYEVVGRGKHGYGGRRQVATYILWGKSPCTRSASDSSRLQTHFIRDLVVRTII